MERRKNKTIQGISPLHLNIRRPPFCSLQCFSWGSLSWNQCLLLGLGLCRIQAQWLWKGKMVSHHQFRGTLNSVFTILPTPRAAFAWRQNAMCLFHLSLKQNLIGFILYILKMILRYDSQVSLASKDIHGTERIFSQKGTDTSTVTCKSANTCSGATARISGSPQRAPRLVWGQGRLPSGQERKSILSRWKVMLMSQKKTNVESVGHSKQFREAKT